MASGSFKDHFSGHSSSYAAYRPGYPAELFAQLAALSPQRQRAWDCATGNGQAAIGLADHFAHIVATDAQSQARCRCGLQSRRAGEELPLPGPTQAWTRVPGESYLNEPLAVEVKRSSKKFNFFVWGSENDSMKGRKVR